MQTGAAPRQAEIKKRTGRKYHDHPEGNVFYAPAAETHGCLEEEFPAAVLEEMGTTRLTSNSRGEISEDRFAMEEETDLIERGASLLAFYL
jgi:hypothetical protein